MRTLNKEEIELRVGTATSNGASFLLYKTARVDMAILDEEFGAMNWRNRYEVVNNNLFCTIEVFNKDINQWISKSDCGVESQTEAQKGEASDAFKRAGFRWGIGRELYSAPFIWISDCTEVNQKGKTVLKREYNDLEITEYEVTDGKITKLEISLKGNVLYSFGKNKRRNQPANKVDPSQGFSLKDASSTVTEVEPSHVQEIKELLDRLEPNDVIPAANWFLNQFGHDWKHATATEANYFKNTLKRKLGER